MEYYKLPKHAEDILENKRILIIIPPSNFSDEEFTHVYAYLKKAGIKVLVACNEDKAKGIMGTKVNPDKSLSEVSAKDFDVIILIGECGIDKHQLHKNEKLLSLLKNAEDSDKIIAGTCMAPKIMAAADIINDKMLTAWRDPELVKLIKEHGGSYIWGGVVSDENLITADSPSSVRVFTDMLLDVLTR